MPARPAGTHAGAPLQPQDKKGNQRPLHWQTIKLDGKWSVRRTPLTSEGEAGCRRTGRAQKGWIPTRVPGEIHLDLVRAGQMEEPLVIDNVVRAQWPEKHSWWPPHNREPS